MLLLVIRQCLHVAAVAHAGCETRQPCLPGRGVVLTAMTSDYISMPACHARLTGDNNLYSCLLPAGYSPHVASRLCLYMMLRETFALCSAVLVVVCPSNVMCYDCCLIIIDAIVTCLIARRHNRPSSHVNVV